MNTTKTYIAGGVALVGLLLSGSLIESRQSQAKGAYSSPVTVMNTTANNVPVSPSLPGQPFYGNTTNTSSSSASVTGIGSGTLAVSSITLTNQTNTNAQVTISQTTTTGGPGGCLGTTLGGVQRFFVVEVPAVQTVHLSFPSPMVYPPFDGQTCISVSSDVNGFLNAFFVGYVN